MRKYRSVLSSTFVRSLASSLAVAFALTLSTSHPLYAAGQVDPDADYDRMDGTGASGETVNVIEWEGNLEIHVAPPGTLKGLALKLDKRNKDRPVMVIGYRFANNPRQQLIRRAILGITMNDGFKAYRDPNETEFDKIIISNSGLSGQVALYKLDPAPTQLYPDGYPSGSAVAKSNPSSGSGGGNRAPASFNGGNGGNTNSGSGNGGGNTSGSRYSDSNSGGNGNGNVYQDNSQGDLGAGAGYGTPSQEDAPPRHRGRYPAQNNSAGQVDDSGTIRPFGM